MVARSIYLILDRSLGKSYVGWELTDLPKYCHCKSPDILTSYQPGTGFPQLDNPHGRDDDYQPVASWKMASDLAQWVLQ